MNEPLVLQTPAVTVAVLWGNLLFLRLGRNPDLCTIFWEDLVGAHFVASVRLAKFAFYHKGHTAVVSWSPGTLLRPLPSPPPFPARVRTPASGLSERRGGAGLPGAGPGARHPAPPPRRGAIFPGDGRGHRSALAPRARLAGEVGVCAPRGQGRGAGEGARG